jgi:hypothetical protein
MVAGSQLDKCPRLSLQGTHSGLIRCKVRSASRSTQQIPHLFRLTPATVYFREFLNEYLWCNTVQINFRAVSTQPSAYLHSY